MKIVKNDLFDYENRYIYQLEEGFKFSIDSILLAEFVKINKNKSYDILDMCTGNAPVLLILSKKNNSKMIGFEIQEDIYKLAVISVNENKLSNQSTIINEDIKNIDKIFPGKYFDIITCNPPYFKIDQVIQNKNDLLAIARHEIKISLEEIFMISASKLKENGNFYMVHRPERLDEIILLSHKYKMPVKEIQLITTKNNQLKIILVRCQKSAKFGIKFRNIINISKLKTYQNMFEEVK